MSFWTEASERHRKIARTFYECDYTGIGGHCPYCATNVKYYNYTGPRIVNV